ncbi:FAD-binding oxidoreductase [Rhizomonospora bruguierae]|uniref:FAD-binding oxidoreductase n=1 Tax=Rhizomonospora bruguierae TaxID=1581705 RepID=UPI0020BFD478|nr:FAD-binding oxidoreductase [Micromonospora sp. NBRC 107566]
MAGGAVLRELTKICGAGGAYTAGAGDRIVDAAPRWVVAPAATDQVSAVLGVAEEYDLGVLARGSGSKLEWGLTPAGVDIVLETRRLSGVRAHRPAELAAEFGAGTPITAVTAHLARTGHRLCLDPPSVASGGTIGGLVATGESGPLRHRYGPPAELLLGATYVGPDGAVVRTDEADRGGHPNGTRLLCGSYGTLAVLVAARFRLHPTPPARAWVTRSVWTPLEVHDLVGELLGTGVLPSAVEMDLPGTPRALVPRQRGPYGLPGPGTLAVLLEGTASGVAARAESVARLLAADAAVHAEAPHWWGRYPFGPGEVALQLAVPIADLHAAVYALRDSAGATVPVRGGAGMGVVHAALPADTPADRVAEVVTAVRRVLLARGGTCLVLSAPPRIREAVDLWGEPPSLPMLRRVKERFDPRNRLSPGRLPAP